jgi:DNA-binding NtrC family response regulator
LSFFELRLLPLRERRLDILRWVDRFSTRWGQERGYAASIQLQPAVAERLLLHGWAENLRGLDRFVHRVLAVEPQATVGLRALFQALPEVLQDSLEPASASETEASADPELPASPPSPRAPPRRPTREEFLAVYEATGRSVRATSKYFGRDRRQIYRWLESFGIER